MLSMSRMAEIHEAAEEYLQAEQPFLEPILRLLPDLSPEELGYLCRCLDRYPCRPEALRQLVTRDFPDHLPQPGLEYLAALLDFPWPGVTDYISPAQVVLGIALRRSAKDYENRLGRVLRDYLERFPGFAVAEFFRIEEVSGRLAESIWSELSEPLRDEIAYAYRQRTAAWHFEEHFKDQSQVRMYQFEHSFPGLPPDFDLTAILTLANDLLRSGGPRLQPGEALLAALPSAEIERALPALQPWVEFQTPPFLLGALLGRDEPSPAAATVREGTAVEEESAISPQTRADLRKLAGRLCSEERFQPRRHGPLLAPLQPAELAFLCGALTDWRGMRWVDADRLPWSQFCFFVQGFDRLYLLRMLETPWTATGWPLPVLATLYRMALSARLLTVTWQSELAGAFARFLNAHPERAVGEYLSLLHAGSLTFAAEVWSGLSGEIRAGIASAFRRDLGSHLESHFWSLGDWHAYLGHQIERFIRQEPGEVSAKGPLFDELASLAEARRADPRSLLGLLATLTPVTGEVQAETRGRGRAQAEEAEAPHFLTRHRISPSFALAVPFAEPVAKAATWVSKAFGRAFSEHPVYIGVSVPFGVAPGTDFVASLYAFVEEFQSKVESVLRSLAPTHKNVPNVRRCRWRAGERVTVHASGTHAVCEPKSFEFEWNGAYEIVDFHCRTDSDPAGKAAILAFAVEVAGVIVATIQLEVPFHAQPPAGVRNVRTEAARTGFASYATEDRPEVLGRVSSIEQSAGMLVFVDCLDLHPGQEWQPLLEREITSRDVFLLFWSAHASRSQWVTWEWQTALARRGVGGMEFHPLQPPSEAPPPKELAHLNFGDRYLTARQTRSLPGV